VCYAEKRCGELALPHMSTSKSAQQLFGNVMHMSDLNCKVVCIMPCYDKKLEAVRPDFKFAPKGIQAKEVDTVLATHEIIDLFNKLGINFADVEPELLSPVCFAPPEESKHQSDYHINLLETVSKNPVKFNIDTLYGRTSNGYLEYIFRRSASELFNVAIPETTPLLYKQGKNKHY